MKVGYFLHTPFPSSEIYRALPVREEVLRAVLGADLIGFHTYDYARHFISSCARILGLEGTPDGVENNGTLTRVAAFPIGIDPERFAKALETEEVQTNISKLLTRYAGRKVERFLPCRVHLWWLLLPNLASRLSDWAIERLSVKTSDILCLSIRLRLHDVFQGAITQKLARLFPSPCFIFS